MSESDSDPVLEYCVHNVTDRKAVESLPVETRGYPCLERCGRCRETPFLVVDGQLIERETYLALAVRALEGLE